MLDTYTASNPGFPAQGSQLGTRQYMYTVGLQWRLREFHQVDFLQVAGELWEGIKWPESKQTNKHK